MEIDLSYVWKLIGKEDNVLWYVFLDSTNILNSPIRNRKNLVELEI
jgi:hypothetical protein